MENGNENKQDKINEEIDRKIIAGIELSEEEESLVMSKESISNANERFAKVLTNLDMHSKMKGLIKSGLIKDINLYNKKKKIKRTRRIVVIILIIAWVVLMSSNFLLKIWKG